MVMTTSIDEQPLSQSEQAEIDGAREADIDERQVDEFTSLVWPSQTSLRAVHPLLPPVKES